ELLVLDLREELPRKGIIVLVILDEQDTDHAHDVSCVPRDTAADVSPDPRARPAALQLPTLLPGQLTNDSSKRIFVDACTPKHARRARTGSPVTARAQVPGPRTSGQRSRWPLPR